ncbi:hypothetical protein [Noviherbaspirillum saxi]|uniref:Beta-barrel porin 2 n=1 Tax=Noviherbaspirillum saxi TaxID=2320863 RepID=A0A3A3G670_9BURK|nr:hypothetical protein [Noviherbaspirillum saxi]RJF97615.1 hypothetical protein D3871_03065 [Noviherbaspirillum saxi]
MPAFPLMIPVRSLAMRLPGLLLAALCGCASGVGAADLHDVTDAPDVFATSSQVTNALPDLQSGDRPAPGYFGLGQERAVFGYTSRSEKWNAKLEQYMVDPALTFDYGRTLSSTFGAGGTITRQNTQSEVVVNGIFSPKKNVRFRLAGAQLRSTAGQIDGTDSLQQNSYLIGARKYWTNYEYLSDLGISAYTVEANSATSSTVSALTDPDTLDPGAFNPQMTASGRTDGYLLNLNLRPTDDSRIELRRELSHSTYYADMTALRNEMQSSNRIRFSQFLDDCVQVHGGYSSSADVDRLDLTVARDKWNIQLSRALHDNGADTAVRIGYLIPLGQSQFARRNCGAIGAPTFEPIVNATMKRPLALPGQPMAIGTIR